MKKDTVISFRAPEVIKEAGKRSPLDHYDIYILGLNSPDIKILSYKKEVYQAKIEILTKFLKNQKKEINRITKQLEDIEEWEYIEINYLEDNEQEKIKGIKSWLEARKIRRKSGIHTPCVTWEQFTDKCLAQDVDSKYIYNKLPSKYKNEIEYEK